MIQCPSCSYPAHSLRGTPTPVPGRRPHLGVVYPCGCWLGLAASARFAEQLRRRTRQEVSS